MRIRITSQVVKLGPGQEAVIEVPDAETAGGLIFQTVERNNQSSVEVLTVVAVDEDDEWIDDAV